jgi:hypothetical protein
MKNRNLIQYQAKYFILFGVLITGHLLHGQSSRTSIPFQLTSFNNISIKAILNQKDTVQLMFHTGAMNVTITEEATKRLKSLHFDKTIDGVKSWGGVSDEARVTEYNSLAIEGLTWDSITITENKHSGQFTDGKFGLDLFEGKTVQINFDKKVLSVSEKLPKRLKGFEKRKLSYENGFMFIEADCEIQKDSAIPHRFLVHSGYAGCILLDDKFANEHKLAEKLKITGEKELKDAYGNVLVTKKAILPALKIGHHVLPDISVGFFPGAMGIQKISAIGGDVLKRFNWIIDADRTFIYLKPNNNYKMPYIKV